MAQRSFNWPINPTTVNSGPIQFEIDGVPTIVNIDTATPSNSIPLPVRLYDINGNIIDLSVDFGPDASALRVAAQLGNASGPADFDAGLTGPQTLRTASNILIEGSVPDTDIGNASGTTLRTVIASDQPAIATKESLNTGSFSQIANLINVAQTFTAPANAVGFKIQAPSTNTENISWSQGSVATITAGFLMEPGRSEDFDTGSDISVIATSTTQQTVTVIWKVRA